jgi:hypothetical protein
MKLTRADQILRKMEGDDQKSPKRHFGSSHAANSSFQSVILRPIRRAISVFLAESAYWGLSLD